MPDFLLKVEKKKLLLC